MEVLPSSEFRKRYPRLTEPTEVTADGRVIGVWTPSVAMVIREPLKASPEDTRHFPPPSSFHDDFHPVPKPGARKRR